MPTKPIVQPEAWATDAVYTTGPFIGQPQKVVPPGAFAAEGHRPGALFPTPAEYENSQQNRITALARWLFLGTSDPDPDAHVVETNAAGRASLAGLDVLDLVDETAVNITGSNTAAPTVFATCTTGAEVFSVSVGNSAGTCFSGGTAGGAATVFSASMTGSPAGARAVSIVADAATSGKAVEIVYAGSAAALEITYTGATGVPLVVNGGTTAAITSTGDGNGQGGIFVSGATAARALTALILSDTGLGIVGQTTATATSASRAVRAVALNNGVGLEATSFFSEAVLASSTTGTAVRATSTAGIAGRFTGDLTAPAFGALFIDPQNADPTNAPSGAVTVTTAKGLAVANFADVKWRSVWHSVGGYACAFGLLSNRSTAGAVGSWVDVGVIVTANDGDAVKVAGATILLRVSMTTKSNSATQGLLGVRVQDTTGAPSTVFVRDQTGPGDLSGWTIPGNVAPNQYWHAGPVFVVPVVVPAVGVRQYTLSITALDGAPTNMRVRDVVVDFVGTVAAP